MKKRTVTNEEIIDTLKRLINFKAKNSVMNLHIRQFIFNIVNKKWIFKQLKQK